MQTRGFSLVEMVVAVAVSGIVAAGAVVAISNVAAKSRRNTEIDQLLVDVQRQRALHVAAGRSEPLMLCVDCVDDAGAPKVAGDTSTLDVYLADTATDRHRGRLLFSGTYGLTLGAQCNGLIALDALGRSLRLPPGDAVPVPTIGAATATTNCQLTLTPPSGAADNEELVFGGDGRLLPSFAPALLPEPPHAQNLSARTTPNPMPRGRFEGDPSRATALPLH